MSPKRSRGTDRAWARTQACQAYPPKCPPILSTLSPALSSRYVSNGSQKSPDSLLQVPGCPRNRSYSMKGKSLACTITQKRHLTVHASFPEPMSTHSHNTLIRLFPTEHYLFTYGLGGEPSAHFLDEKTKQRRNKLVAQEYTTEKSWACDSNPDLTPVPQRLHSLGSHPHA